VIWAPRPWQSFRYVVLADHPAAGDRPSDFLRLHAVLGRDCTLVAGDRGRSTTLPLELQGLTTTVTTPEIYALGTMTTGLSHSW